MKVKDAEKVLLAVGLTIAIGLFFISMPPLAAHQETMLDNIAVHAAMSALDGLAPEIEYGPNNDTILWSVEQERDRATVKAPNTYGDIAVYMLRQGPEYGPYLITVDGEEVFHVTESWARMWFFNH